MFNLTYAAVQGERASKSTVKKKKPTKVQLVRRPPSSDVSGEPVYSADDFGEIDITAVLDTSVLSSRRGGDDPLDAVWVSVE